MKTHAFCLLLVSCFSLVAAQTPDVLAQAELEARFIKTMTGCKMVGFFTTEGQGSAAPQQESYSIARVTKIEGDRWRIHAKLRWGKRSITLPVVVSVRWAGDTPMIQITDLAIPLVGTYTARVLIYRGQYAGSWSGGDHGGHMYGRIERDAPVSIPPIVAADANWPSFRGPRATGVAEGFKTSVKWNVQTGENLQWKTRIPGLSHSSPVIWGNRVFLTTAVKEGEAGLKVGLYGDIGSVENDGEHEFRLLCVDKTTGKILWSRTAWKGVPKIKRHPKGTHAASTAATDGKHVVAFFGSEGLYAYDMDGKLLWNVDLGVLDSGYYRVPTAQWGFASSPVIHDGRVIVQCDVQKGSFVACLDVKTGATIWRTARDEVPTWSTPTVDVREGRSQVIVNGYKHIGGYDLATGKSLWKLQGGGDIPVPTPIVAHDLIFITNAHGRSAPILAISANASGTLTMDAEQSEHTIWSMTRRGNYMQTPLVYGDLLYCCRDSGSLACYEARTGKLVYRERLGTGRTGFTGSGVAADGKLYFPSEEGEIHVVKAGRTFEVLAVNELGETCLSSPALSAGTLFIRGRNHLFAVSQQK